MTTVLHMLHSTGGGAGRATMRLHMGLLEAGVDSRVLCQEHRGDALGVFVVGDSTEDHPQGRELAERWEKIAASMFRNNRTSISNTVIHLGYPGYDLAQLALVREADILHLHWTPRLLSVRGTENLLRLGKPTLWTQHDRWPSSPGYHFPASETDYAAPDAVTTHLFKAHDLPALLLEDKRRSFDHDNLGVICLNEESQAEYRSSSIFANRRLWAMPNAIDAEAFRPPAEAERKALRRSMGLGEDDLVLLLLSQDGREKRKGYALLAEALRGGVSFPNLSGAVAAGSLVVATIGGGGSADDFPGIRRLSLGAIQNDAAIVSVFGLCDMLVMPSEQESFSLAVLEALACGLPVVTFHHSGMPAEHIATLRNGVMIPGQPSPRKLAEALDIVCAPNFPWRETRRNARATAEQFTIPKVTARLLEIYADAQGEPVATAPYGGVTKQTLLPAQKIFAPFDPGPSDWLAQQAVEPDILQMFAAPDRVPKVIVGQPEIDVTKPVASPAFATAVAPPRPNEPVNAIAPATSLATPVTLSLIQDLSLNSGVHRNADRIAVRHCGEGYAVYGPYFQLPPGEVDLEAIVTLPRGGLSRRARNSRAVLEFVYNQDSFLHQIDLTAQIWRESRITIRKRVEIFPEQAEKNDGGLEMRLWTNGDYSCVIESAKISYLQRV